MKPYTPPTNHADRYLQFGQCDLRQVVSQCFYRNRPVSLYPSHMGCEAEACLEINEFANNAFRKLRCQFSVTPDYDSIGLPVIVVQRVDDLPRGHRVRTFFLETYFPEIHHLRPTDSLRMPVPHPSIAAALRLSGERLAITRKHPTSYSFEEVNAHGSLQLFVRRAVKPIAGKILTSTDPLQTPFLHKRRGRPRKPSTVTAPTSTSTSTNRSYTDYARSLKYIGAQVLMNPTPEFGKAPYVRRSLRQWARVHKPDARFSVRWDTEAKAIRITRVDRRAAR